MDAPYVRRHSGDCVPGVQLGLPWKL